MRLSLDTHDARTCYADIKRGEDFNRERAEAFARKHNREVIELWCDNAFDRAYKLELETVRP